MTSDLWYERSVGLKLLGFETNPYDLAKTIPLLSEPHLKGEPLGQRSTYQENQIHIVKILGEDDSWGDMLISLIEDMGGVNELKTTIQRLNPRNRFIVINKPISDFSHQQSNDFSCESLKLVSDINCDISFNFF